MTLDRSGMKAEKMEINLESILPSLAKNLYGDDWRISIRELLQNCHDALAEAEVKECLKSGSGEIRIIPDPAAGTLTFQDNGIGMTADEVREHLATVGAGSKRKELEEIGKKGAFDRALLDRLIGQYGIGFLSSFIVADRVEVRSRSRRKEARTGVRALFTGETQWYSSEDVSAENGTKIVLQLKREPMFDPDTGAKKPVHELLSFERLKQEVRRFGDLLPFSIIVHRSPEDKAGEICNAVRAPWERDTYIEDDLLAFLRHRHQLENEPFSPRPFVFHRESHGVEAHGILYFPRPLSSSRRSTDSVARVELFCRRMFISHEMTALLPDWATFVGVVAECPDLTPILNRNDVIRHAPEFVALRQALGQATSARIREIAEKHRQLFNELRNEHGERLYAALLQNFRDEKHGEESFFREVITHIPFTVIDRSHPNGTAQTLRAYREEARKRAVDDDNNQKLDRIFYLPNSSSIGQYRAMIIQKDLPVIEALHPAEPHLLEAYRKAFSSEVAVDEVSTVLDLYVDEVKQAPYEPLKQYLASLDGGGPDEIRATRFSPGHVPAIALVNAMADPGQAELLERFVGEAGGVLNARIRESLMREVVESRQGKASLTLLLNDSNSVLRSIRDHCAAGKALTGPVADVLHEIYHVARAYTDPRVSESDHFFEHRNKLLETVLRLDQSWTHSQEEQTSLKLRLGDLERERLSLRDQLQELQGGNPEDNGLVKRECALLVTDLQGSSRMVGFLDKEESAEILRDYASCIQEILGEYGGKVEKFTSDGIFAFFEAGEDNTKEVVQHAASAAAQIFFKTNGYFGQGKVARVLLLAGGIKVTGCRTVLHYGGVIQARIAGTRSMVGPQVVAAFRASAKRDLFKEYSTVVSEPFLQALGTVLHLKPIATAVELDDALPPMDFYPHPDFVKAS